MFTIFSTCKPFVGHEGIIQRNAIRSWTLLRPAPEIVLLNDDLGTREIAEEFGLRFIPKIDRASSGKLLTSSMFHLAEAAATCPWLCYVNSDTMLLRGFTNGVRPVIEHGEPALVIGKKWSAPVTTLIDFDDPDWEESLQPMLRRHPTPWKSLDYLFYHRRLLPPMPPFVMGPHPGAEAWFIFTTRASGRNVIDGTRVLDVVHQDHPPARLAEGGLARDGAEGAANMVLTGGVARSSFCLADSTHVLTPAGVRPALGPVYLWRRLYNSSMFHSTARPLRMILDGVLALTRSTRRRLGWGV